MLLKFGQKDPAVEISRISPYIWRYAYQLRTESSVKESCHAYHLLHKNIAEKSIKFAATIPIFSNTL